MGYFGGDSTEINLNNPDHGQLTLQCKANEGNTYDLGGRRTVEITVTGNGTPINKIANVPWEISVLIAWDMLTLKELQYLVLVAGSTKDTTCTISNINGSVYQGIGRPMGDLKGNTNDSTVPLVLSGGGELKAIA